MPVIRLFLLLVALGCLTLLLLQNWSPVLPLVFLGAQTQPLPLAVWILISVVAGALTSVAIAGCFKLSNYFAPSKPRKRRQAAATPPPRSEAPKGSKSTASYNAASSSYTAGSNSQPKADSTPSDDFNDWESDASNDWDFEEDTEKNQKSAPQDPVKDYRNYEANAEPKSGYRSGSVYSYSYREPSNSGVGRTESIYDADYRVLTPPYRQKDSSSKSEGEDEDDWGFEDDEDWENESEKDSPRPER